MCFWCLQNPVSSFLYFFINGQKVRKLKAKGREEKKGRWRRNWRRKQRIGKKKRKERGAGEVALDVSA